MKFAPENMTHGKEMTPQPDERSTWLIQARRLSDRAVAPAKKAFSLPKIPERSHTQPDWDVWGIYAENISPFFIESEILLIR